MCGCILFSSDGQTQSETTSNNGLPIYTTQQVADYLENGYWQDRGLAPHKWDVGPGDTLSVDITGLTAEGQTLAREALQFWTDITGIIFQEVSGSADITFDDEDLEGAYANASWFTPSGNMVSADINIPKDWFGGDFSLNSYTMSTYVHEIGHALGLGHAGNYNDDADYPTDALYINDSWEMSIMSYFSQLDNPYDSPYYFFPVTPMPADIMAAQNMYGVPETRPGDTIYGVDSNAGSDLFDPVPSGFFVTYTIVDTGGIDTFNYEGGSYDLNIDLTPGGMFFYSNDRITVHIYETTILENIISSIGNDNLHGNLADNTIWAGSGNDELFGDIGNDTLYGEDGHDILNGGTGADIIDGGSGIDTASYEGSSSGVRINFFSNTFSGGDASGDVLTSIENVTGSDHNDSIIGNANANSFSGGMGNDFLNGYLDDDTLNGQEGNDVLVGGAGADTIDGGDGIDEARYVSSSAGVDVRLDANTASGGDANGDTFSNIENLLGSIFDDILLGDGGSNVLKGNKGDDVLGGRSGNDTLNGGPGEDLIFGESGNDILNGGGDNDDLRGGFGDDILNGQNGNDALQGGPGSDDLFGGNGTDTLNGETGNDQLYGESGNDVIIGGPGGDLIDGGEGKDEARYSTSGAGVDVRLDANTAVGGDADGDTLSNIENLLGSTFNDILLGDGGSNVLKGNLGDDVLGGRSGNDTLHGGLGEDLIFGESGNDTLNGGGDNDDLRGGFGDDILKGEAGDDLLDGAPGDDVAVFSSNSADYTITLNVDDTITVTDNRGGSPDGTDTLKDIEILRFADGDIAAASVSMSSTSQSYQSAIPANQVETLPYEVSPALELLETALTDIRNTGFFDDDGWL